MQQISKVKPDLLLLRPKKINMDNPERMSLHHPWGNFDLKHNFREHPALKLMDMVTERDAAIAERDTAIAERKTAFAERDSASLQRDVAFAERNAALMERDAACTALSMLRAGKDSREVVARLMQMVNMGSLPLSGMGPQLQGPQSEQQVKGKKGSPKKREGSTLMNESAHAGPKSTAKKKKQKGDPKGDMQRHDDGLSSDIDALVPFFTSGVPPIPHCSCTGTNHQCYRWGKGGWQSTCCTSFLSMYPLPMNPVKRSSRVAGRKMGGNAFKKLLARLAAEGVDMTISIDLKTYWAKHGTDKFATIK